MNTEQIMKLANKLATVSFRYAEEAEEVLREAIEQLVQERDSAVKSAKYAEHIDATPENQRETMLYDALKERDALKAELEQIKAQEPVAWRKPMLPSDYDYNGNDWRFSESGFLNTEGSEPLVLASAIAALVQERDAAQADALEQARLNGMGGEREADLLGKVASLERERDALKAELAAFKAQEPVAWLCCVPGQDAVLLFDEPSDERYPPGYKEALITRSKS